ncbi:uncharacterized protein CTRU02_208456 [Colletotrichum truncatum]|uniref:Uncharacterized protein n=1 Tax=Colletotrichum truncatum TaxID=5467 RepID=A0ACC3YWC3_COLTU
MSATVVDLQRLPSEFRFCKLAELEPGMLSLLPGTESLVCTPSLAQELLFRKTNIAYQWTHCPFMA